MYNGSEKEKINVDELVDFLVKQKDGGDPPVPSAAELPVNEVAPEPEPSLETVEASEPETPAEIAESVSVAFSDDTGEINVAEGNGTFSVLEQLTPPSKKKKRWFASRNAKKEAEEEDWADWGLKPLGHREDANEAGRITAEEIEPEAVAAAEDNGTGEFPAVAAAVDTITMQVVLPSGMAVPQEEFATRVIPTISEETLMDEEVAAPAAQAELPVQLTEQEQQLPDQLSLEEMVRVEDIEATAEIAIPESAESPEETLQRTRQEKVREFTLGGEEEENEPEEEYVEEAPAEEELDEFHTYEDAPAVAEELQYRTRSALSAFLFSGLIEFILLVFVVLTELAEAFPLPFKGYLLVQLIGLGVMVGLNYRPVGRGLSGLFCLRANSDSAPALVGVMAMVDVMLRFADTTETRPYWAPLAGLLLTFCAVGRYLHAASVRRNFAFVSYRGDKYAATLIEEENAVQEIGRRAAGTGEATVGYFHRTGFLTKYLTHAEEEHQGDDWSRWMTPAALGVSLVLSFLSLTGPLDGFYGWLTAFTGLLCITMPVTQLAVQLSLNHCGRVMLSRGGFLVGWKAVRQFGQLDALVVDMADLYPDESMFLHGIKTFSGAHIDEAILAAASLSIRSGGPLSMIFRRIIENKEELLLDVDTLVYEQGMGLSGWVDGRRVLVGNRRLLQNHGVDVPSADYEARYARDGRQLVYLSMAGQLSAMFVVSYLPDPEIQDALQDLCRSHVTLLVRSCDPNIGTLELCESFGLDEYYVDVLPASAGRAYQQLAERASDTMPAVLASNGHILGTAWALSVCRSLRVKSLIALIVQLLSAALGAVLCLSWATRGMLSVFQPLVFILLSSALTWVAPLFKRT